MVCAKPPFGGPAAVLAYLARYAHRIAIANSRLVSLDDHAGRFRLKDYRTADPATGTVKIRTISLSLGEFIRRFDPRSSPDRRARRAAVRPGDGPLD